MSQIDILRPFLVMVGGMFAAGIASSQTFPADLQVYLKLTGAQVQSITDLNQQFSKYSFDQSQQYAKLAFAAQQELQNDSPDAAVAGQAYAQMEMLRRDSQARLWQLQSKVAATLTTDQVMLVNGLLEVERLQPLLSEARCVALEPPVSNTVQRWFNTSAFTLPTGAVRVGNFLSLSYGYCGFPPLPVALTNYLKLTDPQIAVIENALTAQQDDDNRQYLKLQALQLEINNLTAAPEIDAVKLGAAYIAMGQITKDQATQARNLVTTMRGVLNESQQPALKALDNASQLSSTADQAVCQNILVLPPDLQNSAYYSVILLTTQFYGSAYAGCPNAGVPTSLQRGSM